MIGLSDGDSRSLGSVLLPPGAEGRNLLNGSWVMENYYTRGGVLCGLHKLRTVAGPP